jgi:nucleoside-diphosphate-sugar epimerase
MRIVVIGATGNVGSATLRALAADERVDEIVGIARRRPATTRPKVTWETADVARDALEPLLRGADAVIHLAWLIQPSRDEAVTHAVNVDGTRRVLEAAAAAGVGAIVVASSIGAYSRGPKDRAVDESWPTEGTPTSFYARHKAECERLMDAFELRHPDVRLVRLRPALIFQRSAGSEIRRLFAGPLLPNGLLHRRLLAVVPDTERLVFQAVHADDVGDAYRRAALQDSARGAYNIAADPVLDPATLAQTLGARRLPIPAAVLRGAAALTWRLRLQPSPEGWVDMALAVPVMDTARAREELGWTPRHDARATLLELLDGMRDGADDDTPPLKHHAGGRARIREVLSGIGARV